ncbi:restriction endonuclease subunit S [Synechocystis sp. LEGE 06083]|uniref:restriction endonuclease subunit S n=1 Tax=Synechocystis sp. LEGE 06083 TaxID=915336 RepID=UPI00188301F6|nr:restriction endonuclease subunit S [Synechocystis sp. LEGE 06083]MBE9194783.1 restriction endonuclease subunit S [Synechocystis sp. LEGE 06083]
MEWLKVKLRDIVKIKGGGTPRRENPEFYNGNIPWATIKDLSDKIYLSDTQEHINEEAIKLSASNLIPAGNIILATRMGLGKVVINTVDVAINQDLKALFCSQVIYPNYLLYYLKSISNSIERQGVGVTVKGITVKQVENWDIPLPPLSEQKRIVEILDRADELRKQRGEADALSERILPALFIKMFGDPANWDIEQTEPLGKLVNIQSGGTPSKKNPDYWDGDIPWVSAKDMKRDIIYDSIDHITDLAIQETNVKYVEAGSILIVVRGMILAHTIPIALAGTRLTINQDMKALTPNCNKINSTYLHATLKALSKFILSQVGTAGHGTRKFDTEYLLKLPIFIPSQESLKKFDAVSLELQKILSGITQARDKLENLFQILLYRAFSGDLTAKWREAHMTELLQEMEHQTKALNLQPTLF